MKESKNKSNFCIRPFNSAVINSSGEIKVCCEINSKSTKFKNYPEDNIKNTNVETWWESDYLKYVRESFLKNKKLDECNGCWKLEDDGFASHRTRGNRQHNTIFQNKYETNLSLLGKNNLNFPEDIELQITNLCNLKCQMCRGSASSRLLVENNALGFEKSNQHDYELSNEDYLKITDLANHDFKVVSLLGGEPLMNKKIIRFLSMLIENGKAQNILLHITTNGTKCNDDILKILGKFKHLRLMISAEGIGKCNEYMRFPSSWVEIKNNIAQFKKLTNAYVYINTIVQNLNILSVDQLIEFAYENKVFMKLERIERPHYLDMFNLPKHILQEAHERLSNIEKKKLIHTENVEGIIATLGKHIRSYKLNEKHYQEFVVMIKKRDSYRKVHIKDYMPELAGEIYK